MVADSAAGSPADAPWPHDRAFDARGKGCGDVLLDLRLLFADLAPDTRVLVLSDDAGAPVELPQWCALTGHRLAQAAHPYYLLVRRRFDP